MFTAPLLSARLPATLATPATSDWPGAEASGDGALFVSDRSQGLAERIRTLMPGLAMSVGGDFSWQVTDGVLATWRSGGLHTDPKLLEPVLAALAAIAEVLSAAAPSQLR